MPFNRSMKIHKVELNGPPNEWISLLLPADTDFLSAQVQDYGVCLWYICGVLPQKVKFQTIKVETGKVVQPSDQFGPTKFMGTCLLENGGYVVHVFVSSPHLG